MANPQVLCCGEILWDRIAHEPVATVAEVQTWSSYPGGAPANVACALAKLDTTAAFLGCVGQDQAGIQLVEVLQKAGVDTRGVQHHPSAPTRQVDVLRNAQGDRRFAGFGDRDTTQFADAFHSLDSLDPDLFKDADFLVVGTLGLATETTGATLRSAYDLAQTHRVAVVLDVNWRPMFWPDPSLAPAQVLALLPQVTVLKVAAEEGDLLFNTRDPQAIAQSVPQLRAVLVTDGDRGCHYWIEGHQGFMPAFAMEVVDTTGAGDGFVAGFVHQLASQGFPSSDDQAAAMVRFASAVGALCTIQPGAIASQPQVAQVAQFLLGEG
ncbi:carbohydrate kinase family protein [Prochlorothrix hollandica]|uniref:Fructokinase n=1 Tax=Prochlorothrix hollandica PCC 9006 = CALU 1027 TaxID=317619 RepID=A0A0M2PWF9_PROHO|nr:carbohydrate kinase [Prochlorothrix hollandica]KKI98998.1 fructokinase [Prochlorothrix hollandica PCC 9006 = CALU 1027]